jgi:hypothetical protein
MNVSWQTNTTLFHKLVYAVNEVFLFFSCFVIITGAPYAWAMPCRRPLATMLSVCMCEIATLAIGIHIKIKAAEDVKKWYDPTWRQECPGNTPSSLPPMIFTLFECKR